MQRLQADALAFTTPKRAAPRVAFGSLVEQGLISAGTKLFDAKRRFSALVRADGSLSSDEHSGSIHKVGALVQGAEACNGWTFWHFEQGDKLVLIDELRAEVRAKMEKISA